MSAGTPLWRFVITEGVVQSVTYRTYKPSGAKSTPGRWFPEAEAAALLDVAEAARASRLPGARVEKFIALQDALDRLNEARR